MRIADEAEIRHELAAQNHGRVIPTPHLEESDDDYQFVEETLSRWGDRKVPKH